MTKYTSLALLGLAASSANAFFLMPCWPVSTQRVDPIVNPGQVAPHVHQIAGGNGFTPAMNYSDTQAASCTTCFVKGDKSNYWIPALYVKHTDGTFENVPQVGSASMYYFNEKSRLGAGEKFEPFPKGLRMLAGTPDKRSAGTDAASQALNYKCLDYSGTPSDSKTFPSKNCPNGVRAEVTFPSCWDGKNLDSDDHKSHMAYPTVNFENGACPSTHPHHLVTLKVEFIFDTNKFKDQWVGGQQPFVWSNGDPTGYGLHADYLMGWDYDLLSRAVNQCFDEWGVIENCAPFAGQIQSAYTNPGTCKVDSYVDETIVGKVKAMPGCNALQAGPGLAVKKACGDTAKLIGNWAGAVADGLLGGNGGSKSSSTSTVAAGSTPISTTMSTAAYSAAPTTSSFSSATPAIPSPSPIGAIWSILPASPPRALYPKDNARSVPEQERRNAKVVTVTDVVTETAWVHADLPSSTATPVAYGNVRREIGDGIHKHHLRHLQHRRRAQRQ